MAQRGLLCAAAILVLTVSVEGRSDGSPPGSCGTLEPQHHTTAQNGVPPYDFSLSNPEVKTGGRVTVTIQKQANGSGFKGFLLQGRKVGDDKPAGRFDNIPSDGKGLACGYENSSVTHNSAKEKDMIQVDWIAPAPGKYEILQTIARNGGEYWVGHRSQLITVS